MTDWWQQLEERGRLGGWIGLTISLSLLALAVVLFAYPTVAGWGRWESAGPRFIAGLIFVVGVPALFYSARLLLAPIYPSAASVFPPMSVDELTVAVTQRSEDICVCTRCRIVVPADFSTGSCPVCARSIDYQDVRDDEDAKLVLAAI